MSWAEMLVCNVQDPLRKIACLATEIANSCSKGRVCHVLCLGDAVWAKDNTEKFLDSK